MRSLIVGIDPGTTIGYAVLDFEGNVLEVVSGKNLSQSGVINKLNALGTPVLFGTDKSKLPKYVEKLAANFGARALTPEHDMLLKEKKELTVGESYNNAHEFDALASAVYVYKKYAELFDKVERRLKELEEEDYSDELKRLLLKREGLNIKTALSVLKGDEIEDKVTRAVIDDKPLTKKDYIRLINKNHSLKERIDVLDNEVHGLRGENEKLAREKGKLEERYLSIKPSEKAKKIIDNKDGKIRHLQRELSEKDKENKVFEKKLSDYKDLLSRDGIIVRKVKNINRQIKLKKGDIIYVGDPNLFSEKKIEEIEKKIVTVIYNVKPSPKLFKRDVTFVKDDVIVMQVDDFALCDEDRIQGARKEKNLIKKKKKKYQERYDKGRRYSE